MEIGEIQKRLLEHEIDGWLIYDHHGSNRFARELFNLHPNLFITRRLFYWIPASGEPKKLLHFIEEGSLDHLLGEQLLYLSWAEFEEGVKKLVGSAGRIAMEYSPNGMNPNVSVVDGGTIELVRKMGTEVVSSDDLLQHFTSVLSEEQIDTHLKAADVLKSTIFNVWEMIADRLKQEKRITEYDVQKFIISEFMANKCITEDGPTCAVNGNSSHPHYIATKQSAAEIQRGDLILIDLWCKLDVPHGIYADITRVAVAASEPTPRQEEVFTVVANAQKAAYTFLKQRLENGEKVRGYEVDNICRQYIEEKGYGKFFTHRSGHNIDTQIHGAGANLDNFETSDRRKILPCTCFSVEPGIYLPDEFGVRLEYDILVKADNTPQITGGIEETIFCLL
ncbi:MAG: hypothetical protein S4CHLAM45_03330 [Chlamydiales bacterium]|nr:hypothetical protein [Chlamydiales bacterium]MCH9619189.1 hypothetical protein [Chlamydiales bacterium]MCH9622451.1 hypothetical protein [Chlamydiales bacterium]